MYVMRLFFGCTLLLLMTESINAQFYNFPSESWHRGDLVLSDGNILEGSIKYDLEADAIQLNYDNKILTYAANQLKQFRVFQEDIREYRVFYSIPYVTEYGYKRPKLFELIFEGNRDGRLD